MPGLQCILNAAFQLVCGLRIAVDFSAQLPKFQHCIVSEQGGRMCVADAIATCTSLAPIGLVALTVSIFDL